MKRVCGNATLKVIFERLTSKSQTVEARTPQFNVQEWIFASVSADILILANEAREIYTTRSMPTYYPQP